MIRADAIAKSYPTRADDLVVLRDVSLALERGQSAAIMGPSGCGKSTLLNILGTLDTPTAGRVTIDEIDPFALPERKLARFRNERIGYIFQDHHLLPQCSALENVLLPSLADAANADASERARELLTRGRARRPRGALAGRALGRRKAAGRDRAGVDQPTVAGPGRRADRQSRPRDGRARRNPARSPAPFRGLRAPGRHAQRAARAALRPKIRTARRAPGGQVIGDLRPSRRLKPGMASKRLVRSA